jgi:AcrR family transcriptional regulator
MDDIALELEATKGLLYHYFRSKQELLKAILREHPLTTGIETVERGVMPPDLGEALSELALLSLREMRAHRAFIRFLLLQSHSSPEQAALVGSQLLDRWTALFESIIDAHLPETPQPTARLLARQLVDILVASFIGTELGGRPSGGDLEAYVLDAVKTVVSRVEAEVSNQKSEVRGQT